MNNGMDTKFPCLPYPFIIFLPDNNDLFFNMNYFFLAK